MRRLEPALNPVIAGILPDSDNLLVAPMMADGRRIGAVVVAHRSRRIRGVDRRMTFALGQLCSIAALNMRNAVLLRQVQDLAERDSLTGAANRRMFQLSLERVLEAATPRRAENVTAVLFIDLDDFKDGLEQWVARRMAERVVHVPGRLEVRRVVGQDGELVADRADQRLGPIR